MREMFNTRIVGRLMAEARWFRTRTSGILFRFYGLRALN